MIIKFYINVLDKFDINIICYGSITRCFGLVAGLDFILVSEYGENCSNPEIVIYKRR